MPESSSLTQNWENVDKRETKKNYCCPVKLLETIEIRAEYLAWYSALVVTFVFSQ